MDTSLAASMGITFFITTSIFVYCKDTHLYIYSIGLRVGFITFVFHHYDASITLCLALNR